MKTIPRNLSMFRSLCLFLLLLLIFTVQALAAPVSQVNDGAGLLSKQEVTDLNVRLKNLEQKYNVHVIVFTSKDLQGEKAGTVANKLVDQIQPGASGGAMALVIDMESRDWYISTDNTMRGKITDDAGMDYLSGKMVPRLSDGKYADALNAFADTADGMLAYYQQEGKPYDPDAQFSWLAFLIAVVLMVLVYVIVYYMLKAQMSNVTMATEADAYLKEGSFNLSKSNDMFLYTNVSRRSKQKSSASTSSRDSSHGGGGGKF